MKEDIYLDRGAEFFRIEPIFSYLYWPYMSVLIQETAEDQ